MPTPCRTGSIPDKHTQSSAYLIFGVPVSPDSKPSMSDSTRLTLTVNVLVDEVQIVGASWAQAPPKASRKAEVRGKRSILSLVYSTGNGYSDGRRGQRNLLVWVRMCSLTAAGQPEWHAACPCLSTGQER